MPPVETSSNPRRDEAAPEIDEPALSDTESSARRGRGMAASARSRSTVTRRPPDAPDRACQEQRDRPRQQPVLDRPDPVVERRRIVAGQDRDRLLRHDRAAVERRVDEMDRAAGHLHAVGQRVVDGVAAGECRKQRWMRVEDPAVEGGEDGRADDPHVAGQHDRVDGGRDKGLGQRRVVATRNEGGLDPLLRRPVERRAGAIGEDEGDLAAELAAASGRDRARAGSIRLRTRRRRSGRSRTGPRWQPRAAVRRIGPRRRSTPRPRRRRHGDDAVVREGSRSRPRRHRRGERRPSRDRR